MNTDRIIRYCVLIAIIVYLSIAIAFSFCNSPLQFMVCFTICLIILIFNKRTYLSNSRGYCVPKVLNCQENKPRLLALCFIIILFGSVIYWLGFFPGGFNLDAYGQWAQSHGDMQLNDWHPVMSTFLISIATTIIDDLWFYIFLQIILFSFATAKLLNTLNRNGLDSRICYLTAAYIGLSPAIGLNTICLTKDVQFTIMLVFATEMTINICFSDGKWLCSICNSVAYAFVLAMIVLVKHNGIIYVLPLCVLLSLFYFKNRGYGVAVTVLLCITIVIIVKGPLYSSLDVSKHENTTGESVGVPMSIMANALVNDPEKVPNEVHAFLNNIADDTAFVVNYVIGEWDSCKWEFGGTELLQDASVTDILRLTLKTAIACPQTTYESTKENTRIVWSVIGSREYWIPTVYIEPNEYRIVQAPVEAIIPIINAFQKASMVFPLNCIVWNTGFAIVSVLIAVLFNLGVIDLRKSLVIAPWIVYCLGTMFLLAGPNQRYFYCSEVLFLPSIYITMMYPNIQRNGENKNG